MAIVNGTSGSDILDAADGVTNGNDSIYGFGGDDTIFGLGGNDYLSGGAGADSLDGGAGMDTALYLAAPEGVIVSLATAAGQGGDAEGDSFVDIENVIGSQYGDILVGNGSTNALQGVEGHDILKGGGGADSLWGQSGNDTLKGGGGADTLDGGSGIDTAAYNESSEGVFVSLYTNTAAGGDAEDDSFTSIENLTGSDYADSLWGNDGANTLRGMEGSDTLKGYGGADILYGGDHNDHLEGMAGTDTLRGEAGSDTLDGGSGADIMIGGSGNDTYYVDTNSDVVTEAAGQGTDKVRTTATYVLQAGVAVETLETTDAAGVAAIDLVGNAFANTIIGNAGTNVIVGGTGLDTMVGGDGADIFVWSSIAEMGSTVGADSDTVGSEFNALIGDKIALNPIDADDNAANGDTAFTFIGDASNPFTAAGQVSWFNNGPGTDTYMLLNTDGDGTAEGVIRVLGVHTVDASWFVL